MRCRMILHHGYRRKSYASKNNLMYRADKSHVIPQFLCLWGQFRLVKSILALEFLPHWSQETKSGNLEVSHAWSSWACLVHWLLAALLLQMKHFLSPLQEHQPILLEAGLPTHFLSFPYMSNNLINYFLIKMKGYRISNWLASLRKFCLSILCFLIPSCMFSIKSQ